MFYIWTNIVRQQAFLVTYHLGGKIDISIKEEKTNNHNNLESFVKRSNKRLSIFMMTVIQTNIFSVISTGIELCNL